VGGVMAYMIYSFSRVGCVRVTIAAVAFVSPLV
jgi:hypothetical protein